MPKEQTERRVVLEGIIDLEDHPLGDWLIGGDSLEVWLDKLIGQRVRLTIELLEDADPPGEEEAPDGE